MRLGREESALFGKFVRTFIPQTTNMGFYPVNAEMVASTESVYGLNRFSTLQRHDLLGLKCKDGGEAIGVQLSADADGWERDS